MTKDRKIEAYKIFCRVRIATISLFGALLLCSCQSPAQIVSEKEDQLAAAGFEVKPANTPERQAMIARLPPHHFVQRPQGDTVNYVYADPLVCQCLYVGSQQAYSKYMQYLQQKRIADEQETAAQLYSDPSWNWGVWGPWQGGYGFGPGYGW